MADPRSPPSTAKSSSSKTVRSQKISVSAPIVDEGSDRTPPGRSHTPGHLASRSHGGSTDRRRKTSESSIRQRSQSAATKPSTLSQASSSHNVPLPSSNLRPNGDSSGASISSSSNSSNYHNNNNNKPSDPQAGPPPHSSSNKNSNTNSAATATTTTTTTTTSTTKDADSRRPVAMRSTSAIVSKTNSTSGVPSAPTTSAPRRASAPARSRGPYVPFPPLQDPSAAPDVPAAPTSGMYWSRAPTSGAPHAPLRAHTTTLVGNNIFVFGGCDSRTCFNELHVLDADSFHWSTPQVFGDTPVPLRAMTCTAISNRRLVVFGGGDGPAYYNDVYVLDTVNLRWHRPRIVAPSSMSSGSSGGGGREGGGGSGGGGGGGSNNSNSNANIPVPSPRRAHTACFYKNGIYVFGGGDGVRALNDIWRLDVSDPQKMSWKLISAPSAGGSTSAKDGGSSSSGRVAPKARGYHTANMVGSKLIVFGGSDGGECFNDVWVYDVDAHVWKAVHVPVTFRRLSHTSTLVGSYLFVVGGHDGSEYSNDVLLLNLVTMTWDRRRVYGLPPAGRGYHGAVLYDSRLVVIGGFDGSEVFGDVWILELAVHAYYSQISHFTIEV